MMNEMRNWARRYGTLLVLLHIALFPAAAQTESNLSLASYHCQRGEFTIGLPTNWEKEEQDAGQGAWMLAAGSPNEAPSDFFSENINVVVIPADTSSPKDANTRGINMLKRNISQFELLDQGLSRMGANDVAWFIHTSNYQGHTLKVLKVTIINGKTMYLVTCTALLDTFDRYRTVFDQIVSSITFDRPEVGTPNSQGTELPTGGRAASNPYDAAGKLGALIGGLFGAYFLVRSFMKKKK